MAAPEPVNLAAALGALRPKDKQPASARVLNGWISQAERALGSDGGRLGWLVATTITTAALQLLESGERFAAEPDPPGVPPRYAAAVVTACRQGQLTAGRAVELLHGCISEAELPVQDLMLLDELRREFEAEL